MDSREFEELMAVARNRLNPEWECGEVVVLKTAKGNTYVAEIPDFQNWEIPRPRASLPDVPVYNFATAHRPPGYPAGMIRFPENASKYPRYHYSRDKAGKTSGHPENSAEYRPVHRCFVPFSRPIRQADAPPFPAG